MKKLYTVKIVADQRLFFLLTDVLDYDQLSERLKAYDINIGYVILDEGIGLCGVSDLWVYWIEVFLGEVQPALDDCERSLELSLDIHSGILLITTLLPDEEPHIRISSGNYVVYILAYNLGQESEEVLEDETLEQRTDLERYKICLVPGKASNEGVIKGSKYLPDYVDAKERNV